MPWTREFQYRLALGCKGLSSGVSFGTLIRRHPDPGFPVDGRRSFGTTPVEGSVTTTCRRGTGENRTLRLYLRRGTMTGPVLPISPGVLGRTLPWRSPVYGVDRGPRKES